MYSLAGEKEQNQEFTTYLKSIAWSIRHATRLVYQFPGKDGRIISIFNSSNGVPPCQDSLEKEICENKQKRLKLG